MTLSRSITALLLTLSIATPATPALAYKDPYVTTKGYTSTSAINYVKDHDIMNGYSNGSFGETNKVNRAEFAKIITQIDTPGADPRYVSRPPFTDTPANAWYSSYVVSVYQKGWMTGYNDNTFRPDRSVTFAEAAKVLAMVYDLDNTTATNIWYEGYVRTLANRHAIPVSIDSVNDALTRGELADIVYRLDSNNTSLPSRSYNDVAISSRVYNNTTDTYYNYDSNNNCYQDLKGRWNCDDGNYNYDTYYGNNDTDCYYDRNNRRICNDSNNSCYYNSSGRYTCDNTSTHNNCYYDSNNQYRCNNSNTTSGCYYDRNDHYTCDDNYSNNSNNQYYDNNGDCVYDSDGKRVCGGSTYNNNNNDCYYDSNNRYRCDNNNSNNNCYYDSNNRYRCDNDTSTNDCYYNANGRYICDDNYNDNYNDDNGDCVYDSDGRRVCGGSVYNNNNNDDCYYDRYNNYVCR